MSSSSSVAAVLEVGRLAGNRATTALVQRARGSGAEKPAASADDAAQAIIAWIQEKQKDLKKESSLQETNYSVGVARNDDLYISKVGGVTAGTPFVGTDLGNFIKGKGFHIGRDIWLAQQFNTEVTSGNHAEMCLMAAAGGGALSTIYCVAPHCAFCAAMMSKDNVKHGSPVGGFHQVGWAHPFAPIFLGSQASDNKPAQLAALKSLPRDPDQATTEAAGLKWLPSPPKSGRCQRWL